MSSRESGRRFHFLREIATGGFGTVYLAKVMHADGFSRLVAVKLLKAQWSDNDEVTRRIRDEARLLGLLRHRNLVDVIDLTSVDGRAAVVMEYLEAVDLRAVAQALHDQGQTMSVRAALEIVSFVASALDAAYNRPPIPGDKPLRVIHRDIKPSNIMVDETGMVKVLDFGVARSEIENRESHTQELQFGSLDYMAPERLFFEPETPASDIYSLGATLYEILALEKLGKAKGRPERHAAFLEERFAAMLALHGLGPDAATGLLGLLRDSLDFAHEKRPTAADFFQRARTLARSLPGEDLAQWAEQAIPPLVKQHQDLPKEISALVDQVVPEDSVALSRIMADLDAQIQTGIRALGPPGPGGAMPPSVGDQLRRGALAELDDSMSRGFVPSPATGAPAGRRTLFSMVPEAPFEDVPTRTEPGPTSAEPTASGTVPNLAELGPDAPDEWTDVPTRVAPPPVAAPPPPHYDDPTILATAVVGGIAPLGDPTDVGVVVEEMPDMDPLDVPEPALIATMVVDRAHLPTRASTPTSGEPPPLPIFPPLPPPPAAARPAEPPPRPPSEIVSRPLPPSALAEPPARANPEPARAEPARGEVAWAEEGSQQSAMLDSTTVDIGDRLEAMPAADPPPRRSILPYAFVGGCLIGLLSVAGVGGALALDVGGVRTRLLGGATPQITAPEVPVVAEAPPSNPVEHAGPSMRFESAAPGTARISADCTGAKDSRKGDLAVVELASSDSCMITAILEDRSRLRATVTGAAAGTYRCFAGGKEACEKQ